MEAIKMLLEEWKEKKCQEVNFFLDARLGASRQPLLMKDVAPPAVGALTSAGALSAAGATSIRGVTMIRHLSLVHDPLSTYPTLKGHLLFHTLQFA